MNELRFGHVVRCWNNSKAEKNIRKGKYVCEYANGSHKHFVSVDKCGHKFINCELDLEADEFLIGDEVEFSDDEETWVGGGYGGFIHSNGKPVEHPHYREDDCTPWKHCRYPRKEKDEANDELDIDKITNWLADNNYRYNILSKADGSLYLDTFSFKNDLC